MFRRIYCTDFRECKTRSYFEGMKKKKRIILDNGLLTQIISSAVYYCIINLSRTQSMHVAFLYINMYIRENNGFGIGSSFTGKD